MISCKQDIKTDNQNTTITQNEQEVEVEKQSPAPSPKPIEIGINDTVIVKHRNEHSYYDNDFSYYWLTHKDTLDFNIKARQHVFDSINTVSLDINHRDPMLFKTAVKRIEECLKVIEEDFETANLSSLQFKSPIYYSEIAIDVSKDYVKKYGTKKVHNDQISDFLKGSQIHIPLEHVLNLSNKTVRRYFIEKFDLTKQKLDVDYKDEVPAEAAIHGMAILVQLEDK